MFSAPFVAAGRYIHHGAEIWHEWSWYQKKKMLCPAMTTTTTTTNGFERKIKRAFYTLQAHLSISNVFLSLILHAIVICNMVQSERLKINDLKLKRRYHTWPRGATDAMKLIEWTNDPLCLIVRQKFTKNNNKKQRIENKSPVWIYCTVLNTDLLCVRLFLSNCFYN